MSLACCPVSPVALRAVQTQLEMVNADAWEVAYLKGLLSTMAFLQKHPMVQTVHVGSACEASVVQWGGEVRWVMGSPSSPSSPFFKSDLEALAHQVAQECGTPAVLATLFTKPLSFANIEESMRGVFDADLMRYVQELSLEHHLPDVDRAPVPLDPLWSPDVLRKVAASLESQPHHSAAGYIDYEPGYLKGLSDVLEFLEQHPDVVTVHLAAPDEDAGLVVVPANNHPRPFENDLRALEERLREYGRPARTMLYSGQPDRAAWLANARKDLGARTVSRIRATHLDPTFPSPSSPPPRPRM